MAWLTLGDKQVMQQHARLFWPGWSGHAGLAPEGPEGLIESAMGERGWSGRLGVLKN